MSNAEQAATAVVGGIIGWIASGFNPVGFMYGAQLGLLAGTVIFPTQLPAMMGPRLEDLVTTSAQVGTPVVRSWGTIAVPGTVLWLGTVEEVESTEEVGGKGSPEQSVTTFTYYQSIAIGLVGNEISGILRVWENGELVYDVREQQDDETADEFNERMVASRRWQAGTVLYTGTEDQMPDPTIEAEEGVGNVPAFRGLAYIVFYRRQLLDDQARRHPQWRFEVFTGDGERARIAPTLLPDGPLDSFQADMVVADWRRGRYIVVDDTGDPRGFREFRLSDNTELRQQTYEDALPSMPNFAGAWFHGAIVIGYLGHIYFPWFASGDVIFIARINPDTLVREAVRMDGGATEFWSEATWLYLQGYGDFILSVSTISGLRFGLYDGTTLAGSAFWVPDSAYTSGKVCRGRLFSEFEDFFTARVYGYALAYDPALSGSSLPILLRRVYVGYNNLLVRNVETGSTDFGSIAPSLIVPAWTRVVDCPVFLFDEADRTLLIGVTGGESTGGESQRLFKWDPATDSIVWNIATVLPANTVYMNGGRVQGSHLAWPLGTNTRYLDTRDGTFVDLEWYEQGQVGSFLGQFVFDDASNRMITFESGVGPVVLEFGTPSPEDVSLATIVREVCGECGLSESDIDVADLEDRYVHGYARTRPMAGRGCIEPLRMIGFFDCVESGTILKWPTRGKPAVATIDVDDLGAYEGEDAPPSVTTKKMSALELPRAMRVHYLAPSRDYEPGEQISPVRLTTDAVNDVDVDLVAALDDDQAAQIAEVIWADAWRARWIHEIAIDRYWSELEPADAILLPVDGRNERVRIASMTTSDLILRRAELIRDDDGAYESTAVAEPPLREPSRLISYAATELLLLDLPPLREVDDDAGIYAVGARVGLGTAWAGAVIYRSADLGVSWSQVGSVANEATVGLMNTALPAGITGTWDYENSIDVVLRAGTLESRSEAAVLLGANAAAIGVHGRWEIVQFLNAELVGTNRYRLTTLLRGRRGTEHLVGTSAINDYFVLVSGPGVVRLPLSTAQIGQAMNYRAVTVGSTLGAAPGQSFTGTGMALETFSPVHVRGERGDSSEDLTITWIRRDRLYQTMRDGVELPNSEASESYSIDILDGSTVVRTLTSSTPSVIYTAADQTTDFGAPVPEVSVRIYQLSAIVGRGTPAEATI